MGPERGVAPREWKSVVVEVVSPVQDDVVFVTWIVFVEQEHSGAVALGGEGAWVARVFELVGDGTLFEEGEADGLDVGQQAGGDAVVGDVEGPPFPAGPPDRVPD